ncbi:MAG: MgtC/SapB family protein [Rudaea sp.]
MITMTDFGDVALRLSVALLIGAAIGTERHVHGQAAGLRTHALVALAAALAVLVVVPFSGDGSAGNLDAQSRVLQGILTGVGFIGAGMILHSERGNQIHGLTSAAGIWIVAVFGALCGHGRIDIALFGFALVVLVLLVGARIEDAVYARFASKKDRAGTPDDPGN